MQQTGRTPERHRDETEIDLGDALLRFREALDRTAAQRAARHPDELDRAAYALLVRLHDQGPGRATDLAAAVGTEPSTVSRQVTQLVDRGLVTRTADPSDGRASLLQLTDRGAHYAELARRRRREVVARVVAGWPPPDRDRLARLLDRFVDDLERQRSTLLDDVTDSPATTPLSPAPGDVA